VKDKNILEKIIKNQEIILENIRLLKNKAFRGKSDWFVYALDKIKEEEVIEFTSLLKDFSRLSNGNSREKFRDYISHYGIFTFKIDTTGNPEIAINITNENSFFLKFIQKFRQNVRGVLSSNFRDKQEYKKVLDYISSNKILNKYFIGDFNSICLRKQKRKKKRKVRR